MATTTQDTSWTPLEVKILLHYYVSPHCNVADWTDSVAPAVRDTVNMFVQQSLLYETGETVEHALTERGEALVANILNAPMPE